MAYKCLEIGQGGAHLMLTAPAAMLGRILGTKKGLSLRSFPCDCNISADSNQHTSHQHKCAAKSKLQSALTSSRPASASSWVQLMPAPMATPVRCRAFASFGHQSASSRACSQPARTAWNQLSPRGHCLNANTCQLHSH